LNETAFAGALPEWAPRVSLSRAPRNRPAASSGPALFSRGLHFVQLERNGCISFKLNEVTSVVPGALTHQMRPYLLVYVHVLLLGKARSIRFFFSIFD